MAYEQINFGLFTPQAPPKRDFGGETFQPERDGDRLHAQLVKVFHAMKDGEWRTLAGISSETGAPEASVSARLRDLRKEKFGGHDVQRRFVRRGLFEYRLLVNVE